jgi:hypothetical protein
MEQIKCYCGHTTYCDCGPLDEQANQERFLDLVSDEETDTVERAKQRIENRQAMKIDQEEFDRKAQHILDTIVKPQVERYEKAKAEGELKPKPRQTGAAGWVVDEYFLDRLFKAVMIPREYLGKKDED